MTYLRIPEVARRLDVSDRTVRRLLNCRAIGYVKVAGVIRIPETDLVRYLTEQTEYAAGQEPAQPLARARMRLAR